MDHVEIHCYNGEVGKVFGVFILLFSALALADINVGGEGLSTPTDTYQEEPPNSNRAILDPLGLRSMVLCPGKDVSPCPNPYGDVRTIASEAVLSCFDDKKRNSCALDQRTTKYSITINEVDGDSCDITVYIVCDKKGF